MRRQSRPASEWQIDALAMLTKFDKLKTAESRLALLTSLKPLFDGNEEPKPLLRKYLALAEKATLLSLKVGGGLGGGAPEEWIRLPTSKRGRAYGRVF